MREGTNAYGNMQDDELITAFKDGDAGAAGSGDCAAYASCCTACAA